MPRKLRRVVPVDAASDRLPIYRGLLPSLIAIAGGLPPGMCRVSSVDAKGRVVRETHEARDAILSEGLEAAALEFLEWGAGSTGADSREVLARLNRIVKAAAALRLALSVAKDWKLGLPPSATHSRIVRAIRLDPRRAQGDPVDIFRHALRTAGSLEFYAAVAAGMVEMLEVPGEPTPKKTRVPDFAMALWIQNITRVWTTVFERPVRPGSGDPGKENTLVRFIAAASAPLHKPPLSLAAARKQLQRSLKNDDPLLVAFGELGGRISRREF